MWCSVQPFIALLVYLCGTGKGIFSSIHTCISASFVILCWNKLGKHVFPTVAFFVFPQRVPQNQQKRGFFFFLPPLPSFLKTTMNFTVPPRQIFRSFSDLHDTGHHMRLLLFFQVQLPQQQSISVKIQLNLGEVYTVEFVTSMDQARNYDVYSSKELE